SPSKSGASIACICTPICPNSRRLAACATSSMTISATRCHLPPCSSRDTITSSPPSRRSPSATAFRSSRLNAGRVSMPGWRPYRAQCAARDGVVIVGVAQEKMRSFKAHKRQGRGHTPVFDFSRQSVAVNHYYFYVEDRDWGPAFLKIGSYLPYPVKLCLNGHEWVKQWLRRQRIRFESLDNG